MSSWFQWYIWSFDSPKSPFWQKVCCTSTKEPLTMCRTQTITFIWLFFQMCQTQNVLGGPTCCELGFLNHQLIIGIFPHYFCVWIKLDRGSEEPSWTHPKKWIIKFQSSKNFYLITTKIYWLWFMSISNTIHIEIGFVNALREIISEEDIRIEVIWCVLVGCFVEFFIKHRTPIWIIGQ